LIDADNGTVLLTSSTGPLVVAPASASLTFYADLMITPMRSVNFTKHVSTRYVHMFGSIPVMSQDRLNQTTLAAVVDEIVALGGTWAILHQGTTLNPYINYPLRSDLIPHLGDFVELHDALIFR
jgi:hypothetical protein